MSHRTRSRIVGLLGAIGVIGMFTASGGRAITAAVSRDRAPAPRAQGRGTSPTSPDEVRGATTTRLADGRWLIVGGATNTGAVASVRVIDPLTGRSTALAGLQVARSGHTATLLSDGTVLIVGGRGAAGQIIATAERFDPGSNTFTPLTIAGEPRADHTATLLTDGRVLIAGGTGPDGVLNEAELWDIGNTTAQRVSNLMGEARTQHEAELLGDGRVRLARGVTADGSRVTSEEWFDPATSTFMPATAIEEDRSAPRVVASLPENGAIDVPLDVRVALRFSRPLMADTMNVATIVMSGPDGPIDITLVPAEQGRLAFVLPRLTLVPETTYVITIDGATDQRRVPMFATTVTLTTKAGDRPADVPDEEVWTPDGKGWRSNRPDSPWKSLKPLQAAPGVTAVAGQVLRLDGRPLADVTLTLEGRTARSDRTGRFLLLADRLGTGEHTVAIDARTANRPNRTYGFYEVRWKFVAGRTNVLPFTIWSPVLDTAHAVTIPVPTAQETVVTTPSMPGLELHLPRGTTIFDEDHKVVRSITMTPIPLDRTPFPLPEDAMFTMFFTIQPGGAYLQTSGSGKGAWLVYPRETEHINGARLPFLNYDPDDKGWFVYGLGRVTPTAIVPDPLTRIYGFTGASFNSGPQPAGGGATRDPQEQADPVDPATGAFIMRKTDLYLPDVMPLALTRTYNSLDNDPANVRPFGIGMTHAYGLFQWTPSMAEFNEGHLILPDGGRVRFSKIAGTSWDNTVMECQGEPTAFYKAQFRFNDGAWEYTLKDGTKYFMGHTAALQKIRDRYGNEIRLTWSATNSFGAGVGNLVRVTSPNGRWIQFTYDAYGPPNRITDATDNIGRTVHYTYDANGHLETVTNPEGNVTTYTWDANHKMKTIKDGRNIVYLTNDYDAAGRVQKQTLADPAAFYTFTYTTDGNGNITQTEVRNPRGFRKQLAFNADHYLTSEIEAVDQTEQRARAVDRLPGSNLVNFTVDRLQRRTEYTYDESGHVLTIKRLADTPNPVTTTFTYEPKFFQVATAKDPLNHIWTTNYDALGRLSSMSDPLGHQVMFATNSQGLITNINDALQHTWQFSYTGADRTSTTDPLGNTSRSFTDGAGRVLSITDQLGRVTRLLPDKLNRVTAITDPLNGQTAFGYDANNNLLSLTDALMNQTMYSYDSNDRIATRRDPVLQTARYSYDRNNHLTQTIDRKGQITERAYDALDRLTQVTYANGSTTAYEYDAGDRLLRIVDSVAGAITREYDLLDRLTCESTPEGTIDYTYDADGRRQTMTVVGQPQVTYGYDNAHRLSSITQSSNVVVFTYDNADRRSTTTLPNGIVATYGYDDANQLTSLTYTLGQTTLGTLTYTYDGAGDRTTVGGTWARTGLPQPIASATHDAANRLTAWNGSSFDYDQNGNLINDGTTTYSWNARNQLSGLSGSISAAFAYDGFGRRRGKTVTSETNVLYDGPNAVQEQASNGTPTANLLTGLHVDETFTRADSSGASTLLIDALHSTLELADDSGTLQTHYAFEPFGSVASTGVTTPNSQQFTGRENDGSGLYYYRARYYSPSVQRFIGEDPIGFAGGDVNLYRYVHNSPTTRRDPLGLQDPPKVPKPPLPFPKPEDPRSPEPRDLPDARPYDPGWPTNPDGSPVDPKWPLGPKGFPQEPIPPFPVPGAAAVGLAMVDGAILGCVIIETYCALQTQQGYDRCVQAATPLGPLCSVFGCVGRK